MIRERRSNRRSVGFHVGFVRLEGPSVLVPLAVVEWLVYPLLLHDSTVWWLSTSRTWHSASSSRGTCCAGVRSLARRLADLDRARLGAGPCLRGARDSARQDGRAAATLSPVDPGGLSARLAETALAGGGYATPTRVARLAPPGGRHRLRQHDVRCAQPPRTFTTTDIPIRCLLSHQRGPRVPRSRSTPATPALRASICIPHVEYGPAVGANLAVQVPLANLITRYSGLSMVWLLVLLLFNSARILRGPLAGFWAATLIVAPLDVFSLISSKLSFGSSIIYSGLDLSTSTLVGFWAMAALFLPLRWSFQGADSATSG